MNVDNQTKYVLQDETEKIIGLAFEWFKWVIVIAVVLLLFSCAADLRTTTYTVEKVNGRFVEFKGVNNYYYVPSDTIKVGDKVKLKRVYRQSKANVW